MKKVTGAFFDIDGTLYREGLITEMFKKLIKSDIIEEERWYNEVRDKYINWDRRIGNYDDYLLKIAEIYTEAITGLHRIQIEFIANKVVKQKGDRVYIYTRDRIKYHLDSGHKVIAVSGAPAELVKEMADKHGFHDYIGSRYLVNAHQIYTGEILPNWDSKSKHIAINHFVDTYGIDLDSSFAYGDTAGDFSMFQLVGNPIAINPTKELMTKIKENREISAKAKVVVERKDMRYYLTPEDIDIPKDAIR